MNKKFLKACQKLIGSFPLLPWIERLNLKKVNTSYSPVFIIGPPRSGSTALYQLLIKHYKFCFLTNFSNFFYKSPILADKVLNCLSSPKITRIQKSEFGLIKGINAPSESGAIFRYWFDRLTYNENTKTLIKSTIHTLEDKHDAPFLNKNLYNSFRIDKIQEIFPNAVFIHITREPIYIAQSLLTARRKLYGNYASWFGLRPLDYDKIITIEDPFIQVYYQINSINKSIKNLTGNLPINLINIKYENLCNDTSNVLEKIEKYYNKVSKKKIKNEKLEAENIQSGNYKKVKNKDWDKLIKLFKE